MATNISPLLTGTGNSTDTNQTIIQISKGEVTVKNSQIAGGDKANGRQSTSNGPQIFGSRYNANNVQGGAQGSQQNQASNGRTNTTTRDVVVVNVVQAVNDVMTPATPAQGAVGTVGTSGTAVPQEWFQSLFRPASLESLTGAANKKADAGSTTNAKDVKSQPTAGDQLLSQVVVQINQRSTGGNAQTAQTSTSNNQSLDLDPFQAEACPNPDVPQNQAADSAAKPAQAKAEASLGDKIVAAIVDALVKSLSPAAAEKAGPSTATTTADPKVSTPTAASTGKEQAQAGVTPGTTATAAEGAAANKGTSTTTTTTTGADGKTTTTTTTTQTGGAATDAKANAKPATGDAALVPIKTAMGDLGPTTGANGQKMSLGDQILTLVVQAIAKALQPAATQAQQQPNITVETDGKKKATTPATTTAPTTATGATAGKPSLGDQILGMIGQELVKLGKGSANTAPVDTNKTTKATVPAVTPAPVSQTTTPAVKTATTGDRPAINYGTVNRTQSQSTTTNNGNTNVVNNDKVKVTGNNQRVG